MTDNRLAVEFEYKEEINPPPSKVNELVHQGWHFLEILDGKRWIFSRPKTQRQEQPGPKEFKA
jgi:hypothetical protein